MGQFHPPPRPEPKQQGPKEWYEELLEKDELLLYFTATLGVILPGIVYLIYQKVHKLYIKYAEKKEAEKRAEEAAKCELVLLCLGSEKGPASSFISQVAAFIQKETQVQPKIWSSSSVKTKNLLSFRGVIAFISDPNSDEDSAWLLDWMEEIAADSKAKKKARFEDIRFAAVGFGEKGQDEEKATKVIKTIARRMKILGSKQLLPAALFHDPVSEQIFSEWCDMFLDEMEKSLGPESSAEEEATSESELEDESREQKKDL